MCITGNERPDMRKLFTTRPQDDLVIVVVGLVKYKYYRNYSAV